MLGSFLRRLTGLKPDPVRETASDVVAPPPPVEDVRPEPAPPPPAPVAEPELPMASLEAQPGPAVNGPVFSSRAVRDATVVTATMDALGRFVAGQDLIDDLAWRLESLTADQVNFLQLSAEPGLIARAQARAEMMKGAKAAALRKLLADLAGGAIPEPVNRANPLVVPKGPILPPLASLQPRPPIAPTGAAPASAPTPAPAAASTAVAPAAAPTKAAEAPASVAAAPAAAAPVSPAPSTAPLREPAAAPIEPISVSLPPLSSDAVAAKPLPDAVPKPAVASPAVAKASPPAPSAEEASTPAPAARSAAAPAGATPPVPRLDRQDAEARRARLLASLNDTLSSSEAAP